MAAESIGMSQKKKDRAATIGMIIFFSYPCDPYRSADLSVGISQF